MIEKRMSRRSLLITLVVLLNLFMIPASIATIIESSGKSISGAVYSSISGKVIGEDTGKGVSDVSVVALSPGRDYEEYAITNDKGDYLFQDLPSGTYFIGFSKENSFYLDEVPHLEVVLPKGKNVVNFNHILKLGGSVSGAVNDADGITPMAGVGVCATVTPREQEWIDNSKCGATDSSGKFLLQGLPESDNCTVEVMVSGHARLIKTIKIIKGTVTGNTNFTVKWDDVTGISGYVRSSSDNSPLQNARVDLADSSGKEIGYTRTDALGKYSIVGVSPGVYNATAYLPKGGGWSEKINILVEPNQSTTINFELDKPTSLSNILKELWEYITALFISTAYAGDPQIINCGSKRSEIVSAWNEIDDLIMNHWENCDMSLELRNKIKKDISTKRIIIECRPEGDTAICTPGKCGSGAVNSNKIYLCHNLFVHTSPEGCGCLVSAILHELIHTSQKKTMQKNQREKQAYTCAKDCFTCGKEKPNKWKNCNCK
jgi:hypothetical protein